MREDDGLTFKLKDDHPATVSGEQQALRTHRNGEIKDGQDPGVRLVDTVLSESTPSQRVCGRK